jgi:hypothetical protein
MSAILEESRPRRSTLTSAPRVTGRPVGDDIDQTVSDELMPYLICAGGFLLIALTEWWAAIHHLPRQPWLYTGVALVAFVAAALKLRQVRVRVRRQSESKDGERVVGQYLDKLRHSVAAEVFHDIPGDGFVVDHVVLSRKGFFAIETRTHSKPTARDARIALSKDGLAIDGRCPDRVPLQQAQAGAYWLSQLLQETTGKTFNVRGVLLYPGWLIEPMDTVWRCDVQKPWVLEPKALPAVIQREPMRFSESDVKLAAHHLERYIRVVVVPLKSA